MFFELDGKTLLDYDFDEKLSKKDCSEILKAYAKVYDENDDKQEWFDKIKNICEPFGFCGDMKTFRKNPEDFKGSVADVSGIIRVAITLKRNSPDLYFLCKLLGKKEVTKRLDIASKILEN